MTEKNEKTGEKRGFCCEGPDIPCLGGDNMEDVTANCCEGWGSCDEESSPMSDCMKHCRSFPLIPIIFGAVLFALGYFGDVRVTRILWLTISGLLIVMGVFGLVMFRRMALTGKERP